jgi:hypothetical protein
MNEKEEEKTTGARAEEAPRPAHRVRLPGFVVEEEIGLGRRVQTRHVRHGNQTLRRLRKARGRAQSLDGVFSIGF